MAPTRRPASQGRIRETPSNSTEARSGDGSHWADSGDTAFEKARQEQEAAEARRSSGGSKFQANFRFRLPVKQEAEIIILDSDVTWAQYEHHIPGPGMDWSKSVFEPCPRETENCPLCTRAEAEGRNGRFSPSYYVMLLSVLDLSGYTTKKGVKVAQTRRILPIKPMAMPQWQRIREAGMAQKGSMRGMYMFMRRDNNNQVNIGEPVILDNGSLFDWYSEEDLVNEFGHEPTLYEGKVTKEANEDITAFDYPFLFAKPSAEDLRQRYGGPANPGSSEDNASTWQSQVGEVAGSAEPAPATEEVAPPPRARARASASTETAAAEEPPFEPDTQTADPAPRARARPQPQGEAKFR